MFANLKTPCDHSLKSLVLKSGIELVPIRYEYVYVLVWIHRSSYRYCFTYMYMYMYCLYTRYYGYRGTW